jgi:acetaldehyde dehydrogenase (acetylating)
MIKDKDLISIQEVRELIDLADHAFDWYKDFSQEQIDHTVLAMSRMAQQHARQLAEMAVEETHIGIVEDKFTKNMFAATRVYDHIRDMKTVGILRADTRAGIMEVAMPVGIICGIIPTTNPTSSVIFKSLIALKAGNPIIFSPHPTARKSILAAAELMHEAAVSAGAPRGIIGCTQEVTLEGTRELMTHPKTALILATGGSDMVRAAYSSGKPAYGVGPGNVPVYIHSSANIHDSVGKILKSKTFDNGTVCSSEQAILADVDIVSCVERELTLQGGYFLSDSESDQLGKCLITAKGTISPGLVGRSAVFIAETARIPVPEGTRVLIVKPSGIGPDFPLSREKLSPVLAFYEVSGPEEACLRCMDLLRLGGLGHSLVIHAEDESVIREFALNKPVSRLLVNTPSTHGAIGYSTSLTPSLTLGCGSIGGNVTSDNITATHLFNIRRVAYHKETHDTPSASRQNVIFFGQENEIHSSEIRKMVKQVMSQLGVQRNT